MTTIATTGFSHIRFNVSDVDRSRKFYDSVFGWPVAMEVAGDADDATREQFGLPHGGVIYDLGGTLFILRGVAPGSFDSDRIGLNHIALSVRGKDELDAAAARLDDIGVHHEPVLDIGPLYALAFRDPDNIALELAAAK